MLHVGAYNSGFEPYEKGCLRRTVVQPIPICPPTFHPSMETGSILCTKPIGETPLWTCEVGTAEEGGVCVERQTTPPIPTCPNDFVLQQVSCVHSSKRFSTGSSSSITTCYSRCYDFCNQSCCSCCHELRQPFFVVLVQRPLLLTLRI